MTADVRVEGADTLARTLGTAADRIGNPDEANRKTATMLVGRGKGNAPVKSGQLARSIHVVSTRGEVVEVGTNLIYGPVIHFGWRARGISPNPYLFRALASSTPAVVDLYAENNRDALRKVRGA